MNRIKIYRSSAIVSLIMCALTSSATFLVSRRIIDYNSDISAYVYILTNIFNVNNMNRFNFAFIIIFTTCTINLLFFANNTKYSKYINVLSLLFLIAGVLLFVIHVVSNIMFYNLSASSYYYSTKYLISKWIPRILMFMIPTLYLIVIQIDIIYVNKRYKLNRKNIIIISYSFSVLMLTAITFIRFTIFADMLLGYLRLVVSSRIIVGDLIYGDTVINYRVFFYYIVVLTLIFGIILAICILIDKKCQIKNK